RLNQNVVSSGDTITIRMYWNDFDYGTGGGTYANDVTITALGGRLNMRGGPLAIKGATLKIK
ncbi:MAG: hypothetical protein NWE76_01875, partial [Candidatus Bathyarchaeota archaeon]|nr:hypothetical protein [Candidatus Bathyarchaeota archaeon]